MGVSVAVRVIFPLERRCVNGAVAGRPKFPTMDWSGALGLSAICKLPSTGRGARTVAAGLLEPEADAMLETWRVSYFQTPGLRLPPVLNA